MQWVFLKIHPPYRTSFSPVYDHGCATLAFVNNIFHDQNICATSCKSFRERNANFQYSLYLLRRILDQNNRKFGQYGLCFCTQQSYLFKTINSIFNKVFCGVSRDDLRSGLKKNCDRGGRQTNHRDEIFSCFLKNICHHNSQ